MSIEVTMSGLGSLTDMAAVPSEVRFLLDNRHQVTH